MNLQLTVIDEFTKRILLVRGREDLDDDAMA
jgi:hypothetical protein